MVDLETMSLRRDPKTVMGSLRRLKGAAEATESILGDRRTTGIAMGRSIDYLSGKTQLLPQDSVSILPSVRSFVQGMEPDLQKENVNDEDPVRQTLRKLEGSVASLRRPAVEHRHGYALRSAARERPRGPAEEPRRHRRAEEIANATARANSSRRKAEEIANATARANSSRRRAEEIANAIARSNSTRRRAE
ncbi:uncharacterized protein LOC124673401 isoform X2 [Lolium rigidum]|nr:uncharacterized protein LOC124673401 isoform X2 [Lolium rigidum]XP_047065455.1 uncharacterized protein LOC124673401 isoform X2 [Lolium rigidum]